MGLRRMKTSDRFAFWFLDKWSQSGLRRFDAQTWSAWSIALALKKNSRGSWTWIPRISTLCFTEKEQLPERLHARWKNDLDWNPAGSMTIRTAEDRYAQTRTIIQLLNRGVGLISIVRMIGGGVSAVQRVQSETRCWLELWGSSGRDPGLALLGHPSARATDGPVPSWMLATVTQSHGCPAVKQAHAIAEELLATRQQGSRGRRRGPREFRSSASARQNCASNHNNCERQYHAGIPGRCTIDGDVAAREKFWRPGCRARA